jgi:hypothetical protein
MLFKAPAEGKPTSGGRKSKSTEGKSIGINRPKANNFNDLRHIVNLISRLRSQLRRHGARHIAASEPGAPLHEQQRRGPQLMATTAPLPPTTVPQPSTWAMTLAGFAGLGFVGFRRSRKQPMSAF